MRLTLSRIWGLTRRAAFGPGAGIGFVMFGTVLALIFVTLNLVVDIIQASLDPRIAR